MLLADSKLCASRAGSGLQARVRKLGNSPGHITVPDGSLEDSEHRMCL